MAKLYKIKLTEDFGDIKAGEVLNVAKRSLDDFMSHGCATYLNTYSNDGGKTWKEEKDSKSKKTSKKNTPVKKEN